MSYGRPNEDDYDNLINLLKKNPSNHNNAIGSYGNESFFLGPDEKLFTDYYKVKNILFKRKNLLFFQI
jgi:hypothetical protein